MDINNNQELLLIKRRENDVHYKGSWEIPGGRLELDENPFLGLIRETKEETGLDIKILNPLSIEHFTREDNQKITMIIFLAKPLTDKVILSKEHTEYIWIGIKNAKTKLNEKFHHVVDIYEGYFKNIS